MATTLRMTIEIHLIIIKMITTTGEAAMLPMIGKMITTTMTTMKEGAIPQMIDVKPIKMIGIAP